MQLAKDKIKSDGMKQKSLLDPTLGFNVHWLKKKFGKHFQKSMILKASKIETL